MPDGDALDALAPQPAAAPAPAPAAPSPSSAAPPAPPAVAAPQGPAASPAPASAAQLQPPWKELGYESAAELREDLAFARHARQRMLAAQEEQRRNDPAFQARDRQNAALDQLLRQQYGDAAIDALSRGGERENILQSQWNDAAASDMQSALAEAGLGFDDSKDGRELSSQVEERLYHRLMSDRQLNQRYHASPAERRAVIVEHVAGEERLINFFLLRQNAASLRDHTARQASQPRGGRAVAATPRVRDEKPTATDPLQRRHEAKAILSRQLDDVHAHFHA